MRAFKNKEKPANNSVSLLRDNPNMFTRFLANLKQKYNQQCRKIARVLHHNTHVERTNAINPSDVDFTTTSLKLPQERLSLVTAESFKTLRQSVLAESQPPARADNFELLAESTATDSTSTIRSCVSVSPASISAEKRTSEKSSVGSASSSETALITKLATAAAKPTTVKDQTTSEERTPARSNSVEASPLYISRGEPGMPSECASVIADKQKKAPRWKVAEVFNRLKTQLWPRITHKDPVAKTGKDQDCSDRCQWDVIAKIKPATVIDILRSALPKRHKGYQDKPMKIVSTAQGSFHLVFMVKTFNPTSHKMEGWVVKIPGHGTHDRWTSDDEYMLTQEVETMRLVTTYTNVPASFVVDYSATLDNQFGFPYIVMKELPGKSACELWYDEHCEIPSLETEQKRENMLRSLAGHMTELNKLRFEQIGMPMFNPYAENFENFDDIEEERLPVNKYYVWPFCDTYQSVKRGPFPSTQAFIRNATDSCGDLGNVAVEEQSLANKDSKTLTEKEVQSIGTSKFFNIITSHPVFQSTASDTFALRHSDLDLQNILIDDEGNVTGILDWDGSLAMPRCVGHAAVPHFLELDWYKDAVIDTPFACWRAGHYRNIYAAALADAGNPDVRFTSKSHMYQAVFAALYEGGSKQDVMMRLLKEVPALQIDVWTVKYLLAKGCEMTEQMLKKELWKVLEPEMPPSCFRGELEKQHKDAAVQG